MLIIKYGNHIGDFHFKCSCGCEWYAQRTEVSFTPPCMSYDVYMTCPCCKKETSYIHD